MSVRARRAGAVDFLSKPFQDQTLLTAREREVLALAVSGLLNKQAGFKLGACEKTIKVHRSRGMRKMRAGSLAGLVRTAEKLGIHRRPRGPLPASLPEQVAPPAWGVSAQGPIRPAGSFV